MATLHLTRSLQDLVFDEARGLVLGGVVSVYDGLYRVGRHCSATVAATPLGGKRWRIQFEFRAFEPELVDWSLLRISLRDTHGEEVGLRMSQLGTAEKTLTFESFSLNVSRLLQEIDSVGKVAARRPELPALKMIASTTEIPPRHSDARRFRSLEVGVDLWILQFRDQIHVVVATAELRADLHGKNLKLLLIREATGGVRPALTVRALEYRAEIPDMDRFAFGELAGKPGWFRYEQYRVPINEDFSVDLIEY